MMLKNNKVTDFVFTIYSIQSDDLVLYTHKSTIAGKTMIFLIDRGLYCYHLYCYHPSFVSVFKIVLALLLPTGKSVSNLAVYDVFALC